MCAFSTSQPCAFSTSQPCAFSTSQPCAFSTSQPCATPACPSNRIVSTHSHFHPHPLSHPRPKSEAFTTQGHFFLPSCNTYCLLRKEPTDGRGCLLNLGTSQSSGNCFSEMTEGGYIPESARNVLVSTEYKLKSVPPARAFASSHPTYGNGLELVGGSAPKPPAYPQGFV